MSSSETLLAAPKAMSSTEYASQLRRRELEAYANVISVFRAHGELTDSKKRLINELRQTLKISQERHIAEVKRALNDDQLATIASEVHKADLVGEKWLAEVRVPRVDDLLDAKLAQDSSNTAYRKLKQRLTEAGSRQSAVPNAAEKHAAETVEQETVKREVKGVTSSVPAVHNTAKCDAETQTDLEKLLEKQVAGVIAEIVDGRRTLGAQNADQSACFVDLQTVNSTVSDEAKKTFRKKAHVLVTKKAGKQIPETSARRVKLMKHAIRKRMERDEANMGKRQRRNSDNRKRGEPKQARRRAQSGAANRDVPATSVSAAGVAQPTRLQVLDSSYCQSDNATSTLISGETVGVANEFDIESGVERFELVIGGTSEQLAEETRRSHSDSENGSLNLKVNDTTFIQQTLLSADKHELVPSASGGSHMLINSAGRATATTLPVSPTGPLRGSPPQGVRRTQRTPVPSKKRVSRETAGQPARANKRLKRDSSTNRDTEAPVRGKGRKKRTPSGEMTSLPAPEKGAAFKVKLPALHKAKGPSNGSTNGRDSLNASFNSSSNANAESHHETGAHAPLTQLLPTFACATNTSYNYSSLALAHHSQGESQVHSSASHTVSNSAAQSRFAFSAARGGAASMTAQGRVSSVSKASVASNAVSQPSMYEFVDEASTPCGSGTVWSGAPSQSASQAVALVPTGLPTQSVSSGLGVNATQARGAVSLRGRGAVTLHGRGTVIASSAVRPASVNRIVCVDRSQSSTPQVNVTAAVRPSTVGLTAVGDHRNVLLARRGGISAPPRATAQPTPRSAVTPSPVSVIMQKGIGTPAGIRPPIVTRKLPSQSIVSVIKPTLSNQQAK